VARAALRRARGGRQAIRCGSGAQQRLLRFADLCLGARDAFVPQARLAQGAGLFGGQLLDLATDLGAQRPAAALGGLELA